MTTKGSVVHINLKDFGNFFQPTQNMAELDNAGLPYTDAAQISALRQEYEAAAFHGGRMATEKCFKYVDGCRSLYSHSHRW